LENGILFIKHSLNALHEAIVSLNDIQSAKLANSIRLLKFFLDQKNGFNEKNAFKWEIFNLTLQNIAFDLNLKAVDVSASQNEESLVAFLENLSFISLNSKYTIEEMTAFLLESESELSLTS